MYKSCIKRILDLVLSLVGIVALAIPMLVISIMIFVDDPGPVVFMQKRVGLNKKLFHLYKFRSMKMSTPHDTPTHLLDNPDQYITRVGRVLRKYSLDELPQIINILKGDIAIIGPRPALWNQDDLIAERDKYGANNIKPGLTGWAQINGRDELEICEKAKLDGYYTKKLNRGGIIAFVMDMRCFVGTITSVMKHEGVVEGGTGELKKKEKGKQK